MTQRAILVVDDQEDLREILEMKLTAAGYRVTAVANGRDAIKAFAQEKFDLVLTDMIMPERDGLEVIWGVRQAQPGLPVIAMSGGGRMTPAEYLKMARSFGAIALLEKPFSDEQLLSSIALALPAPPAGA
jgi:CheY-like chemotaxis protein